MRKQCSVLALGICLCVSVCTARAQAQQTEGGPGEATKTSQDSAGRKTDSAGEGGVVPSSDESGSSSGDQNEKKLPPVADILGWIASNVPAHPKASFANITLPPNMVIAAPNTLQELKFVGCTVTLTSTSKRDNGQVAEMDTTTVDLRKFAPGSASVLSSPLFPNGPLLIWVVLHSDFEITTKTVGFLRTENAIMNHTDETERMEQSNDHKDFAMEINDKGLAERMTHAWNDAIKGCGGKTIPKDLY